MNENKFTPTAEEALRLAQEAAGELGHGYVGTEHLLLGLMREDEGLAHTVLTEAGLTDELLTEIIRKSVGAGLPGGNPAQGLTPRAKRVIEVAMEDSIRGGYAYIGMSTCWPEFSGRATIWLSVFCGLPVWMPVSSTRR